MKKLLLYIISMLGVGALYAQPAYTISPPSFTAEDEITVTINVTGTPLDGFTGDVWMWAWIAEGCSASCDAPTNVNPANASAANAQATRDANNPNVYSITLVPSAFYKKPPSEIKRMGFLLKGQDWSTTGQTPDIVVGLEPLVFTPKVNRIFPTKVTQHDIVTLYLDQSVATAPDLKYEPGDFNATIVAYDEDHTEIGKIENAAMVKSAGGLHYIRIMPSFNFGRSDIHSIQYSFTNAGGNVKSDEFSLVFFQ